MLAGPTHTLAGVSLRAFIGVKGMAATASYRTAPRNNTSLAKPLQRVVRAVDSLVGQIHNEDVHVIPPAHHLQKKFPQFRIVEMTITNCPQTEPWPQKQVCPAVKPLSS